MTIQKHIKIVLFCLLYFAKSALVGVPLAYAVKWIFINTRVSDVWNCINFFGIFEQQVLTPDGYVNVSDLQFNGWLQLVGFAADILMSTAFLGSMYCAVTIVSYYKNNILFHPSCSNFYRIIGVLYILDSFVFNIIGQALMVGVVTFNNPVGHRYIAFAWTSRNMESLLFGLCIFVFAWVMKQASAIHDEHSLTI